MIYTPVESLNDKRMRRSLLAAVHPDNEYGSHELSVYVQALLEACDDKSGGWLEPQPSPSRHPSPKAESERIPYDPALGHVNEFLTLTMRALSVGQHAEEQYASILALLTDCPVSEYGRAAARQCRGASYKQLCLIGSRLGWSKPERVRWYEIARNISMSDRHASHLIDRLKHEGRRAA